MKKDEAIKNIGEKKVNGKQQLWMKQRDELIVFIKDRLDLKYTEMEKELRKGGIEDVGMETIRRVYRRSSI